MLPPLCALTLRFVAPICRMFSGMHKGVTQWKKNVAETTAGRFGIGFCPAGGTATLTTTTTTATTISTILHDNVLISMVLKKLRF